MKIKDIDKVLTTLKTGPTKWELDNVIYHDRYTNPKTLHNFLTRIKELDSTKKQLDPASLAEYDYLVEMLEDMDIEDIESLTMLDEEQSRDQFIEELARKSAIEVMTNGKLSFETFETACKFSPSDFILCAKRTQDLINSIQGLVIKGETLSQDVAQA